MYAEEGSIGAGADGLIKKDIRNVDLYQIPMNDDTRWAFDKLARIVSIVNAEHFDYEIMGITHELQLLHYDSGEDPGHYEWHVDVGNMTSSTRKISVSVQLTAPDQYTGGDLMVNSNGEMLNASRDRGALALFPSYCLHKVTPMQEGERWALVIWVHGSKRFR
jgi:PKHD-type hydroxylase